MAGGNIAWLDGLSSRGIVPGLDSISELTHALGNPQNGLRLVHVAGSDGKGSTCCMLESILRAAGYRTGLFTSPFIMKVNESIRVDGLDIDDDSLDRCLGTVRDACDSSGCQCTNFEALVACALSFFKEQKVDIAIIEVGMGGRLDATNIIMPEVSVISNISVEHTKYLGSTVHDIASEKAGIIKPGVPCVTTNCGEALEVIRARCSDLGCPLTVIDPEEVVLKENAPDHVRFRHMCRDYETGLTGSYQRLNAALAIEAVRSLKDSGRILPFAHIGLHEARWPARMQKLPDLPIILDATHTKKGSEYLRRDISEIYGKVTLVIGMLSDKDLDGVAANLSPIATKVFVSSPDSPRAADKEALASVYRKYHDDVTVKDTVGEAVEAALEEDGIVLVTGSFRTAEDCLRWLRRTS